MAKIVKDFEEGKTVQTQELEKAYSGYTVLADFEIDGKAYKAGDRFIPPSNWTKDDGYEEFRNLSRKPNQQSAGLAFVFEFVFDARAHQKDKTEGVEVKRVILPLKEK